jgi:hypothetical protein
LDLGFLWFQVALIAAFDTRVRDPRWRSSGEFEALGAVPFDELADESIEVGVDHPVDGGLVVAWGPVGPGTAPAVAIAKIGVVGEVGDGF